MNRSISSNAVPPEGSGACIQPGRDPDSWARELPAPMDERELKAACEELLAVRWTERRDVLHRHAQEYGDGGRIQIVAALVEEGFACRHVDPYRYLQISQLANQCAYRYLCATRALRPAGRQLRAAALGFLANAYRVCEDGARADRCWRRLAPEKVANPVLAGYLFRFRGELARVRYQFSAALSDLEEARRRFEQAGVVTQVGVSWLALATTYENAGQMPRALATVREAVPALLRAPGSQWGFVALHNLADLLSKMGLVPQAAHLLRRLSWRYREAGDDSTLLRAQWISGRLLSECGAWGAAVAQLTVVKDGLVERKLHYDAALVGLEIALGLLHQKDSLVVMHLARELYPVFVAHDIPQKASAVLLQFHRAAEELRADVALVREALEQLRQIAKQPSFPSSPR